MIVECVWGIEDTLFSCVMLDILMFVVGVGVSLKFIMVTWRVDRLSMGTHPGSGSCPNFC